MTQKELSLGTTTVGIVCKDGLVLAADRRAGGGGGFIVDRKAKKVHKVTDRMAVTIAGVASDAQLIIKLISAEIRLLEIRKERPATIKEAANLLSGIVYHNIRRPSMIPGISQFILAGKDEKGFHLYDVYPDGSLSECDEFKSSGSGSTMAYGVLETLYDKNMTVKEGIELAKKSINAAIQRDMNSGEGVDILTVTKEGVQFVLHKTIDIKL